MIASTIQTTLQAGTFTILVVYLVWRSLHYDRSYGSWHITTASRLLRKDARSPKIRVKLKCRFQGLPPPRSWWTFFWNIRLCMDTDGAKINSVLICSRSNHRLTGLYDGWCSLRWKAMQTKSWRLFTNYKCWYACLICLFNNNKHWITVHHCN